MTSRGRKKGIGITRSEIRQNRSQAPIPYRTTFLASGTADTTVFLRGDLVWAVPVGGTVTYSHVHSTGDITSGIFNPARLGSGTATVTTFLRGDGSWAAVSGSADGSMSDHAALLGLQGGTTAEYYHLTSAQWARAIAGDWASATHAHSISDIASLWSILDAKASATHVHTIAQVTNLQTTLDGKASVTHVHTISDVTGLQTALDSKASATLTLSAGQIVGGRFDVSLLGSGTATSTTFLRGDGSWATPSGSADGSMSSHQALTNLLGGTTNEYYHLTSAQWQGVVNAGWASATHVHAASDVTSGVFSRTLLGSLSASTASFLRGTGEWTPIGWSSATHNHAASEINSGTIATARLGSGTADNTTYLRGDSTWQAIAGATPYIERFNTATCSAAAYITYQTLAADQIASQSNSDTVMFATLAVGSGTWNFSYNVIYQSAATTTGIGIRVNHTGASPGHFVAMSNFVSTGGAAATGVADQVQSSQTAGIVEGKGERVLNTKSSFTVGVDTVSANCLVVYSGILVVTNSGDLQLKVTSEVNGSNIHVKAGSHLILQKVA